MAYLGQGRGRLQFCGTAQRDFAQFDVGGLFGGDLHQCGHGGDDVELSRGQRGLSAHGIGFIGQQRRHEFGQGSTCFLRRMPGPWPKLIEPAIKTAARNPNRPSASSVCKRNRSPRL